MKDQQTQEKPINAVVLPTLPSAFTLFRTSIEIIARNIWTFVLLFAIPAIFMISGSILLYIGGGIHGISPVFSYIGIGCMVLGGLLSILAMPALLMTQVKSAQGKMYEVDDALRDGMHIFWRYFGLTIAMTIIMIVALALLIVPFFFALRRYILAPYYLADLDTSIAEALEKSAADSVNFKGAIWGLIGVQTLIGFVVSVPLIGWAVNASYYCAPAGRYMQIKKAAEELAHINARLNR